MKIQDSTKGEVPMAANGPKEFADLGALCDAHIQREFADRDVNVTMETMVPEPYVYSVPSIIGGFGGQGVQSIPNLPLPVGAISQMISACAASLTRTISISGPNSQSLSRQESGGPTRASGLC